MHSPPCAAAAGLWYAPAAGAVILPRLGPVESKTTTGAGSLSRWASPNFAIGVVALESRPRSGL